MFYDYFYPGYKAGGPVQSLVNLSLALSEQYEVNIITTAYDLNSQIWYADININKWNKITLPGSEKSINVFYSNHKNLDKKCINFLIKEVSPHVIYFNGIFSYRYFLLPLLTLKTVITNYKVIICPRGMLQKGALAVKPFKKKMYLAYLRFIDLLNNVSFHATNEEEENDIKKHFPKNKEIVIAPNIPKPPFTNIYYPLKQPAQLKLVFLSLITKKKNILLLLQLIQASEKNIILDIYGPVTDKRYWQQCESLIAQMPGKVQHKGEVQPAEVQKVLSQYHALILLTKGENFGHALYESMSVGRPVVTSYFTPWTDLQQQHAGVNVDISSVDNCLKKLQIFAGLNQTEYNLYCNGAHQAALQYYQNLNAEERYRELFG